MANYYDRGNVKVDSDFARFGSKSYAINKINSVEVRTDRPTGDAGWIICGIIALLCLLSGLGGGGSGIFMLCAVFALVAAGLYHSAQKRIHKLFLMTSSSEAQALQSEIKEEVDSLRAAIEQAMVARA